MDIVNIDFENCYGIKNLQSKFSFADKKPYSIYAPNGFMKTSFAKTFIDHQNNSDSCDLIFTDRESKRVIKDDNGNDIAGEQIFVIESYKPDFSSDKTTLLLVNQELKNQYDKVIIDIQEKDSAITKRLKQMSGLTGKTVTPHTEILKDFDFKDGSIYDFYAFILDKIDDDKNFSSIVYNEIFNEKAFKVLSGGEIKTQIKEYIEKYNELIDRSPLLNKGFNHYNAHTVAKNLSDNGFFNANHSVNLFDGKNKTEILKVGDLNEKIESERVRVFNDPDLIKAFDAVDAKLTTADHRKFRDYLFDNKEVLPELENYAEFKVKLWMAYFCIIKNEISDFVETYEKAKAVILDVSIKANEQKTDWEHVVDIFNERFNVPFKLKVENQSDVILKGVAPYINFEFSDSTGAQNVEKEKLIVVLSQGEKRALYILNLLFEINAREKQGMTTLFIVDDIADSFDYKNKYAIIEYLRDVAANDIFNVIFLTHNFDFHRTISSRIGIPRVKRLFTTKNEQGLAFCIEKYQNNPFLFWKKNLSSNNEFLIASIPFVRNLAEYCGNEDDFNKLTCLLHDKDDTVNIKVSDLEDIYKNILADQKDIDINEKDKLVVDLIHEVANDILKSRVEKVELEQKVILSIAIRLLAERFMKSKIQDHAFFSGITSNQTFELFGRYVQQFPQEAASIAILSQVNLMTPENIHLNSFMYEPILDMSSGHLYELFDRVIHLT